MWRKWLVTWVPAGRGVNQVWMSPDQVRFELLQGPLDRLQVAADNMIGVYYQVVFNSIEFINGRIIAEISGAGYGRPGGSEIMAELLI